MNSTILVVDDEMDFLESVKRGLLISGYKNISLLTDPLEAARLVEGGKTYDIALLDITMPGMSGLQLLELIRTSSPRTECIMVTAINEVGIAVQCMQKGAYDYMVKPILHEDLVLKINRTLEKKRLTDILELKSSVSFPILNNVKAFSEICTIALPIRKTLREAELHAGSNLPILITGESGTGKELLARAIHKASLRAKLPFVAINMASMSETLFEAEFFGHTKGAFTGADRDRSGYLENAHRGTLFLDEIGSLPLNLQAKLLRVLQEGEFMKIGSSKPMKVDIRLIAATNQDLERLLAKGLFRKDLYYRLRGTWLHLLPLRERRDDIPVLIERFLDEFSKDLPQKMIEQDAMSQLMVYEYPGNVRELKSIIQASVNLAQDGQITLKTLPSYLQSGRKVSAPPHKDGAPLPVSLAEMEKAHILSIYQSTGHNKTETAKRLDIGLSTLRRKLQLYGLE